MEQFGPHARHKIHASTVFLMTIQCHVIAGRKSQVGHLRPFGMRDFFFQVANKVSSAFKIVFL